MKISGEFPRIFFNNNADSDKIQSVDQWGTIAWTSFVHAFNDCKQLKILATDAPDLSNVTDLGSAFKACRAIGNPDLSNWDVSGITNMNSLFFFSNFNGDVTTWDVGSVTNFAAMFAQTPFNQDISGWNIGERVSGNSITMSQMFALAKSFSYNIGGWDMSKVINALQMLRSTDSFDYDLGGWDISNMVNMTDFLSTASLSSVNYDNTLIGWSTLNTASGETKIPVGINLNGGNSTYCLGESARNILTSAPYNWGITDAGAYCAPVITLTGDNPQTIQLSAGYTELGASTDDGSDVVIDASEFMNAAGTYTVYYNASNASGYDAVQLTRTVNVIDPDSKVGNTLSFDGIDDTVIIPNNNALEFNTGIVEVWVKPDWVSGAPGYNPSFIGLRDVNGSRFSFHIRSNYSAIDLYNGAVGTVNYNFVQGKWYHITLVLQNSLTKVYINGKYEGAMNTAVNINNSGKNLNIGSSNGVSEYFKGEIDDIRIWTSAMTYCETVSYRGTELSGNEDGLIAYYNFDHGTAGGVNSLETTLSDLSSNGLNGTLTNFNLTGATSNWIVSSAGASFTNECLTYVPDDNFEQALIDLGHDDTLDDYVLTSNISTITLLDLDSKNISDLTGIEDFISLSALQVRSNNLTVLNVSSNSDLKTLYADYNNLSSVDLSANAQLTRLAFVGNGLNELILPDSAINLYEFNVADNNLQELDLSGFPNMTFLIISGNKLLQTFSIKNGNNINIAGFQSVNTPLLRCIEVDDRSYSETNWTNIDSNNAFRTNCGELTFVPDANFEQALINLGYDDTLDNFVLTDNINTVTTLNVSSKSITDLTGIEGFSSLQTLNCRSNNLTTIDLSSNLQLINLVCGANSLTSLDVSVNSNLQSVAAELNDLTEIYLPQSIRILNIEGNDFIELDLSGLPVIYYLLIKNNPSLRILNIKNGNNTNLTVFEAASNPLLYCIEVDDVTYSTTNWTNIDTQTSFSETSCDYVMVDIDVFLQGASINPNTGEESLMRDDLRMGDYLPTTSPYSDVLTCATKVFDATGDNAIVDWIWVELRNATDATKVIGRSALLQRDGDIVDVDGISSVSFSQTSGDYYIVVSHRNHLSIRSAATISLSSTVKSIDFISDTSLIEGGSNAVVLLSNGKYAIVSGDYDSNGQIQNSDTSSITSNLGSSGYNDADLDMNGQVQNSDINTILNINLGKGVQFTTN